jgi:hypothetical protein
MRRARSGWLLLGTILVLLGLVLGSFGGWATTNPVGTPPAPATPVSAATVPSTVTRPTVPPPAMAAPALPPVPTGPPSGFRLASIDLPGPHPSAWGASGIPPGWIPSAAAGSSAPATTVGNPIDPEIEFYSTQNGSGGNVTWNVTLPVDRSPTANQSDLYAAVDFGLTVTAPTAWMNECFLELQLYPDATWYGTHSDNGNWIGAVVAWQIQTTTGTEDPCFYEPLYANGTPGPGYLNMSQGDRLSIGMTGWPGNPAGETLTVLDHTNGNRSYVVAYNTTGNFPLNPAYTANDVPDALQWSTGGVYPISFGLLTGRAGNPSVPSNNSYGGCSPGLPPPTPSNPAVPCPSFDPGSWVNDTLHPWQIDPPTFFNATGQSGVPAQVAFSQSFGGIDAFSALAGGACQGRLGSSYCSFPWFSYACALGAFEFGAVNFPGVSADFGEFGQYSGTRQHNAAQFPLYAPKSFATPTCGGPAYAVAVGPAVTGGSVTFLDRTYASATPVSGLGPGTYQLEATPPAGEYFAHWTATGNVTPALPYSPWTSVTVRGNGSVLAVFSATKTTVAVTFHDAPSGQVAVASGLVSGPGSSATMTVPASGVVNLTPGVYSLLAYSPAGFQFTSWGSSGSGQSIASTGLPFTWLLVTDLTPTASVTADYSPSNRSDRILLEAYDPANSTYTGGTVSLGGFLTTDSRNTSSWLVVGTYNLSASPAPGFRFGGWYYTQSSIMLNFSSVTNITLENGTVNAISLSGFVRAIFIPQNVAVMFTTSSGGGGVIVQGYGFVAAGASLSLTPGVNYSLSAAPGSGLIFVSWGTPDSTSIWNRATGSWSESLVVNKSGVVVANYGAGAAKTLSFEMSPVNAGQILFNGNNLYSNGSSNSSVVGGETYRDEAVASTGFSFAKWIVIGAITVGPSTLPNSTVTVSGSGTLIASFVTTTFPVTILTNTPNAASVLIDGSTSLVGSTLGLTAGAHTAAITIPPGATFIGWNSTPGLTVSNPQSLSTSITVTGSGALWALISPFAVSAPSVTPAAVDVGIPVSFLATAPSSATYTVGWSDLPAGCSVSTSLSFRCSPTTSGTYPVSVTFTDTYGEPAASGSVSLTVSPPPAITSLNASHSVIDVGLPTTLVSTEQGGTGPFTWSYAGLPTGCSSANRASLTCSPSAAGTFNITVTVIDAFGETAVANLSIVVNPLPSLAVSVTPTAGPLGTDVTITATASGGTGPLSFNYSGLPPGCPPSVATSLTCRPTSTGTFHVTVTATDVYGKNATQIVTLVVSAPIGLVVQVTPAQLGLGLAILGVVAGVAFLALRPRRSKPTIVASPRSSPGIPTPATYSVPPSRTSPAGAPEWSEAPSHAPEWKEDR